MKRYNILQIEHTYIHSRTCLKLEGVEEERKIFLCVSCFIFNIYIYFFGGVGEEEGGRESGRKGEWKEGREGRGEGRKGVREERREGGRENERDGGGGKEEKGKGREEEKDERKGGGGMEVEGREERGGVRERWR